MRQVSKTATILRSIHSGFKTGILYYYFVAISAVVYILFALSPVFSFFFNQDDLVMFDLGAMLKNHPFVFLSFSYCGWWRPIGFTGAAFLYMLFGLNPFPFHVAGFLIHLFTAILIVLFARRLFDLRTGLLAFVFYITSTLGVSSVGFISNSWQDELGEAFIILAMLFSMRISGRASLRRGPYIGATFFLILSAACKESWIAYIPVALFIDYLNYRQSRFLSRILRIAPLMLVFGTFYFRAIFGGSLSFEGPWNYFIHTYSLDNILWGATLPFLPFGVAYDKFLAEGLTDWSRILAPLGLFLLAWFIGRKYRRQFALLAVIYLGFLLVLAGALLNNGFWGWYHLPILVMVAAILMAYLIEVFLKRFPQIWAYVAILTLIILYSRLQYTMLTDNMKDCQAKTRIVQVHIRTFILVSKELPQGSMLVAFDGPSACFAMDALLPKGVEYRSVFNKQAGSDINEYLQQPMDYVRSELGSKAMAPTTIYVGQADGVWKDYTKIIHAKLAAETSVGDECDL